MDKPIKSVHKLEDNDVGVVLEETPNHTETEISQNVGFIISVILDLHSHS